MHAARNLRLCTKDCVCLFICPTGATNTETGQIDFDKCLDGCRLCVDACPSGAIYLVSSTYPKPQAKSDAMADRLFALAGSKAAQEDQARSIAQKSDDPSLRQLCKVVEMSNRIIAEDLWRESGYIIAQRDAATRLLEAMLAEHGAEETFPAEAVKALINARR